VCAEAMPGLTSLLMYSSAELEFQRPSACSSARGAPLAAATGAAAMRKLWLECAGGRTRWRTPKDAGVLTHATGTGAVRGLVAPVALPVQCGRGHHRAKRCRGVHTDPPGPDRQGAKAGPVTTSWVAVGLQQLVAPGVAMVVPAVLGTAVPQRCGR